MFAGVFLIARRVHLFRRICLSLLIPYIFLVIVATIITRTPTESPNAVLTPFVSFKEALTNDFWDFEIKANILMFIPFGFLLSMVINRLKGFPLLVGFFFSVTIEAIQYFTHRGVFETDDIITNFMGILIGFIIFVPAKMIIDDYLPL